MHHRAKCLMKERLSNLSLEPPLPQFAMNVAACIMLDGWSSRANRHYVAILLRTLDSSFRLVSNTTFAWFCGGVCACLRVSVWP
jgi:hypothetical protein